MEKELKVMEDFAQPKTIKKFDPLKLLQGRRQSVFYHMEQGINTNNLKDLN